MHHKSHRLTNFDKDGLSASVMEAVQSKYISNDLFTPENAAKASPAAEVFCRWVRALYTYRQVVHCTEATRIIQMIIQVFHPPCHVLPRPNVAGTAARR